MSCWSHDISYLSVDAILENVRSVHTWQPSRGIMVSRLWRTSLSRKRQLSPPPPLSLLVFLISGTSAQQCARVHTTGSTRGARVCHVLRPVDVFFSSNSNVDLCERRFSKQNWTRLIQVVWRDFELLESFFRKIFGS